jgi:integrase
VATFRLKYVIRDIDRYGKVRIYVRVPGRPKVAIKARFGTPDFFAAYHAAIDMPAAPAHTGKTSRSTAAAGTLKAACERYFASPAFLALDVKTRTWRRRSLDEVCQFKGIGNDALANFRPVHIRAIRDSRSDAPSAGNERLAAIKALFAWAVENELVDTSPAAAIKAIKTGSTGYHTWTPEEVAAFETRFPIGTTARLAIAILLYTACRREDVVRLGPQHIRGGRLQYRQAKNEHRKPVDIDMMVPAELAKVIAGTPASGHLTFLVTKFGKPFTVGGFGERMAYWVMQAGLPSHCTAHGLRKASATRLAEAGATAHEIMAVTGHRTLGEAQRYTQAAGKRGLADAGILKMQNKAEPK